MHIIISNNTITNTSTHWFQTSHSGHLIEVTLNINCNCSI